MKSIKNILIIIIAIIMIFVAYIVYINQNYAEKAAINFLQKYYTINDTALVDIISGNDFNISEDLEKATNEKYGELLTQKAIDKSASNRIFLEGENAAKEKDAILKYKDAILIQGETYSSGAEPFEYIVSAIVKYKDGSEKEITQEGFLIVVEEKGAWKVDLFRPEIGALRKAIEDK